MKFGAMQIAAVYFLLFLGVERALGVISSLLPLPLGFHLFAKGPSFDPQLTGPTILYLVIFFLSLFLSAYFIKQLVPIRASLAIAGFATLYKLLYTILPLIGLLTNERATYYVVIQSYGLSTLVLYFILLLIFFFCSNYSLKPVK